MTGNIKQKVNKVSDKESRAALQVSIKDAKPQRKAQRVRTFERRYTFYKQNKLFVSSTKSFYIAIEKREENNF